MYYEARAEELVERTDENGLTGEPDLADSNKVWELRCAEIAAADFTLVDPCCTSGSGCDSQTLNPSEWASLYVPGTQVPIRVHATEERVRATKQHTKKFHHHKETPQHILVSYPSSRDSHFTYSSAHPLVLLNLGYFYLRKIFTISHYGIFVKDFLRRNKVDVDHHGSGARRTMRYREAIFEHGEQIGVLGMVEEVQVQGEGEEQGEVHGQGQGEGIGEERGASPRVQRAQKVLLPVSHQHLTKELCAEKGWSDMDRRCWKDLTDPPSIILTDVAKYMQVSSSNSKWGRLVGRHRVEEGGRWG